MVATAGTAEKIHKPMVKIDLLKRPWLLHNTEFSKDLPADLPVNESQRHTGVVTQYNKHRGFGFIIMDDKGIAPKDEVFVHWRSINSSDRYPHLVQDMRVLFTLEREERWGKTELRAANVCDEAGQPVSVQDMEDSRRIYVGGQFLRYTGILKFYDTKRCFGYIRIDDGYQYDMERVPSEIRAEQSEMNCGGKNPARMEDTPVEFGIWKDSKGQFKAYSVTGKGGTELPGMDPEDADNWRQRELRDGPRERFQRSEGSAAPTPSFGMVKSTIVQPLGLPLAVPLGGSAASADTAPPDGLAAAAPQPDGGAGLAAAAPQPTVPVPQRPWENQKVVQEFAPVFQSDFAAQMDIIDAAA